MPSMRRLTRPPEAQDPRRGVVDERRVDGVGREEVVAEPVDEVVAFL